MTEIIVPEYYKRTNRYEEMKGRDPLDHESVTFVDGILIPKELHDDFAKAAELCGVDIPTYIIAKAGWAAIHDLTGGPND